MPCSWMVTGGQLVAHASVHCFHEAQVIVVRHPDGVRERSGIGCIFLQRAPRNLAELRDGIRGEQLGAAIDGMDRLPIAGLAGIAAGEIRTGGTQSGDNGREIVARERRVGHGRDSRASAPCSQRRIPPGETIFRDRS